MGQDPTYQITAENYPLFLWRDSHLNHRDPYFGFLRSSLLVRVCHPSPMHLPLRYNIVQTLRHIVTALPPEDCVTVQSRPTGVTVPAIAYAAVIVGVSPRPIYMADCGERYTSLSQAILGSVKFAKGTGASPIANSTSVLSRRCRGGLKTTVAHYCYGGASTYLLPSSFASLLMQLAHIGRSFHNPSRVGHRWQMAQPLSGPYCRKSLLTTVDPCITRL